MKITLLRHAEVQEEYKGKYNGHIDIGLSVQGKAQAKALAQKFKHIVFERVYCSDLLRAKETLQPFTQAKDAIYTPMLREKSWGEYEGMSYEQIVACGVEYNNFTQWVEALGGEDIERYTQRIEDFFAQEIFTLTCENVLIVTHSGVIKTLIAIVQNISLEEAFSYTLPYSGGVVFCTKEQTFSPIK